MKLKHTVTTHIRHRISLVGICPLVLAFACLVSWASCSSDASEGQRKEMETKVDTTRMLVEQIHRTSKLYTADFRYHKIVTYSDEPHLKANLFSSNIDQKLPIGERKVAIPIDVNIKAYIDLSQIGEENIRHSAGRIDIVLPDPRLVVTAAKIDHRETKEYVDLLRSRYSQTEIVSLARQGEESILKNIDKARLLRTAQNSAASVLLPMLLRLGYSESQASITFRNDLLPETLTFEIEKGARL